jgi:hypothetical protein
MVDEREAPPYTAIWSPDGTRVIVGDEEGQLGVIEAPRKPSADNNEIALHGTTSLGSYCLWFFKCCFSDCGCVIRCSMASASAH